ncbi:CpaF family protein [Stutzerimonas kirkiae]|uniref:CpaF family protein n=1 Tax=Stutzerimonas kirkiae TaxID=2211392 RepID=UPI001038361D|nr:CpaF family protein [Stutzerimonas kirkiae]TBV07433.1 secretion system protein E [Stutzerimonas kirkiae]
MSFGRKSSAPAPPEAGQPQQSRASAGTPAAAAGTGHDEVPAQRPGDSEDSIVRSDSYAHIRQTLFATLDISSALERPRDDVRREVETIIAETVAGEGTPVPHSEQLLMAQAILDDMFGVGPIEPLLQDDNVSDIMVNGPDQIYVERFGKLELTLLKFRDNAHVVNVAQRIASSVGRRVDESSPMVDARLADGSRVNVVLPPLAIDGAAISIRKFSRKDLTLQRLAAKGSLSQAMARVLEIAAASRLNILISGGTGSGKTTLLNALSRFISVAERIITVEDAAELQLQQPHVLRLETRPANLEGGGRVTQGDLVRNALRMRPDRIILGETRGAEALDVLQAMNTGHDGSMTTLHANTPRDALIRLESMVLMANGNLPLYSIRRQIASAVQLIVQVERMRDGSRRVTSIVELAGMEGDVIVTQELFRFNYDDSAYDDLVKGTYDSSAMRPIFAERARYYGMESALLEAMQP